jgi:hypothetical protein
VVVALVAVLLPASAPTRPQASDVDAAASFTRIPVHVCASSYGVVRRSPKIPKTRVVGIPPRLADHLSVYVDREELLSVIGPRGFRCVAAIGADGGGGMDIYRAGNGQFGASVSTVPACIACLLQLACPYFRTARAELLKLYGRRYVVSCHIPKREEVIAVSGLLRRVDDPPHVKGDDYPSGAGCWALGDAYFRWTKKPGSYLISYTLPSAWRPAAYASLNWFEIQWRRGDEL